MSEETFVGPAKVTRGGTFYYYFLTLILFVSRRAREAARLVLALEFSADPLQDG